MAEESDKDQEKDPKKDQYFEDLCAKKKEYADRALERYNDKWRIRRPWLIFRITGTLIILGSVSLPYLAQITTETNKTVISLVSLGVALLTALSSFFGWQLRWQKGVAAKAALEHYIANWEIGMLKAKQQKNDDVAAAHDVTSYLFTQVFATVSSESEALFQELKSPKQPSSGAAESKN